ncbi:MAG: DegT/DnrJ/EryC1/StrS family aminotransferase [Thermoleophilaceae bacterium]
MSSPEPLRLAAPRFGDDALDALAEVLAGGRLTQGPKVAAFEEAIASYCGVPHAVATTSASTALHVVLAALDLGPGDEVVVPDFTYPATGNAVLQTGASLRLVDVDPRTYNVDPDRLAHALTERTKAVIAVDLFGLPADYTALDVGDVPLVCDAACALGAEWDGRRCGAIGAAACFSFHPRKVLTTGEGGMVTTADDALAARLRRLVNHGSERDGWRSTFVEPGFNYRLSELQAALGLVQVPHHDAVVERRRELAARLSDLLADVDGIELPFEPPYARHCWQAYVCVVDEDVDRDALIAALRERGVESTLGTYALHAEPAYAGSGEFPVSLSLARRTLALPLHEKLADDDPQRVADAIGDCLRRL